ncbi:hypothetical protein CRG98_008007 [Punica granatum]|uniref:Uncharacterized protein n=1 Tax=Punica granatum TaxID=22663 RepID=A0A2I0KT00_PUNGR|nr:hypothetical protein CRG98_008007 [Punica granatum]
MGWAHSSIDSVIVLAALWRVGWDMLCSSELLPVIFCGGGVSPHCRNHGAKTNCLNSGAVEPSKAAASEEKDALIGLLASLYEGLVRSFSAVK